MIDAVFLTSNSRDQALKCIAHLDVPEIARIFVIDNASIDGTAEAIRAAQPHVSVIALDAPTGLATAMNRGAALGTAPFILYLNDDVFATPGAIARLLETLQGDEEAVAVGGRLVDADLKTQDRYRPQPFPSSATVVGRLLGFERFWPRNPLTGRHLREELDDRTTIAVDQPAGACILVRRPVAERVGGWDERYWFWYEDVDFCRRLAAHGTQLYVPTAVFRHVGGSTARRLRLAHGHQRVFHGMLIYSETHFSRAGRAFVGLMLAVVGTTRALIAARHDREATQIYLATTRDALALLVGRRVRGLRAADGGVAQSEPEPALAPVIDGGAPCPVCAAAAVLTERFRPTVLRQCSDCGLLFRAGEVGLSDGQRMYTDDTYSVKRRAALTQGRGHDARCRAAWVRARVSGLRLLDVGAGAGFFVAAAGEEGFNAVGVEPSDFSAEYARTELGVDVRTGFLHTAEIPEAEFDTVCLWHVLEHAPNPVALLREIHGRLRQGGRLVIEVPNVDSVGARIMGGRWAHLDPSAHWCHFGPHSISVALGAAGYAVVELETLVEGYYDDLSTRLRPRRMAGRIVRALHLRTLALTHSSRGELLRVVAERR